MLSFVSSDSYNEKIIECIIYYWPFTNLVFYWQTARYTKMYYLINFFSDLNAMQWASSQNKQKTAQLSAIENNNNVGKS